MNRTALLLPYYQTPCYEHMDALARIHMFKLPLRGCATIDQARNVLITKALEFKEPDVFVFIDGDIAFHGKDLQQLIDSCRETKGIVGGMYSVKRMGNRIIGMPTKESIINGEELTDIPAYEKGRVYPTTELGMGFTAIHRDALDRMTACEEQVIMTFTGTKAFPLFYPIIHEGVCHAEDASFCIRARRLGISLSVDTRPRLRHYGAYGFRLEDAAISPADAPELTINPRS